MISVKASIPIISYIAIFIMLLNSIVQKSQIEIEGVYRAKQESYVMYKNRRNIVKDFCAKYRGDKVLSKISNDSVWNKDIWYDYNYNFMYCEISKVGSYTWLIHLYK